MKIAECQEGLGAALECTRIAAAEGTPLWREAFAVAEMARAYREDGCTFYKAGDPVNALAAAWYGAGWLHFGIASGLLVSYRDRPFCPFAGSGEKLQLPLAGLCEEKTRRYERLLDTARASVACTGEAATISCGFSEKVLFIAGLYAARGRDYRNAGAQEDALSCFSYGHGWLDAGVTCGYFHITAHRELFTV